MAIIIFTLIFPLHYFECIENYYITRSEQEKRLLEEKLSKNFTAINEYERFLGHFYHTDRMHPLRPLNTSTIRMALLKRYIKKAIASDRQSLFNYDY